MGDQWRLSERDPRLLPLPAPAKRARADFGVYIPGEGGRFDDGRTAWREADTIGGTNDLVRNGMAYGPPGVPNTELGLGGGPGIGMSGAGSGGLGSLGVSGLDNSGMVSGPRPIGPDTGLNLHGGRPEYVGRQENPHVLVAPSLLPPDASPTLFIEGLPSDTTRREASHVFRPFVGFKEVRLVHKEPKRPDGDKLLLCFVDFADARCAAIALEALQGYKFDENDRESSSLRLQFARFPGPRGAPRDDHRGGRDRDDFYRFQGNRR